MELESFTTKSSKDQFYWQGKYISFRIFRLLWVKKLLRLPEWAATKILDNELILVLVHYSIQ